MRAARDLLARMSAGDGPTGHLVHRARLAVAFRRRDPILVYSPAQTGSMTVLGAVQSARPENLVVHVHRITRHGLDLARQRRTSTGGRDLSGLDRRASAIRAALDRSDDTWPVITTVRDPVAREVSGFFSAQWAVGGLDPDMDRSAETLESLLERFDAWGSVWTCEEWFVNEFAATIGADPMSHDFDPQQGWAEWQSGRFRVLVLRTESLDERAEGALARFLAAPTTTLSHENATSTRPYGELYRWFLESVRLPADRVDRAYLSRYAQHFYTDDERERGRARWVEGRRSSAQSGTGRLQ